jgi:hypothetical protein
MASPVIFLDIDGVLLTGRAWDMPVKAAARDLARRDPEAAARASTFDPSAVQLLNDLVVDTWAKLVISSNWRYTVCPDETLTKLVAQGVPAGSFHAKSCCPVNPFRREKWHDIREWLGDNRTTTMPLVAPAYPWPEERYDGWELFGSPLEAGAVGRDSMQDDGDFASDGDLGLSGADPLHQPGSPSLQGRPTLGSVQQHAGRLEEVGPE